MNHSTRLESVQSQYDWSNVAPSMAVIDALASLEDVRPMHLPAVLDDPLYDFIDPEALDELVTDEGAISISFTIADYDVQIDGDMLRIHYKLGFWWNPGVSLRLYVTLFNHKQPHDH